MAETCSTCRWAIWSAGQQGRCDYPTAVPLVQVDRGQASRRPIHPDLTGCPVWENMASPLTRRAPAHLRHAFKSGPCR